MDLTFSAATRREYSLTEVGIEISIILSLSLGQSVRLQAKVDTGAEFCVFKREYAEQLGVSVEEGLRRRLETVTGAFDVFGHTLNIQSFDCQVTSMVYFAANYDFPRNVLGRVGWIDQFQLGLVAYESAIYLKLYNDLD